jgi:hypothetical protein
MKILQVFALSVAILSVAIVTRASVPIVVATPGRMVSAMKLFQQHLALFQQHKPIRS